MPVVGIGQTVQHDVEQNSSSCAVALEGPVGPPTHKPARAGSRRYWRTGRGFAEVLWPGHESWHSRPGFYYEPGGGPLFDIGPYFLTALICLFGPAARVSGVTSQAQNQRVITSRPLAGQVKVPTHVAGTIEFGNGAIATITTSFDVAASTIRALEV